MKWPWVSRSAHELVVSMLQAQIAKMEAERTVLYDRLGLIGLGGPLFAKDAVPVQVEEEPQEEVTATPEHLNYEKLMALRGNPRALRREVARQVKASQERRPNVAWIPQPVRRIDELIEQSKKKA